MESGNEEYCNIYSNEVKKRWVLFSLHDYFRTYFGNFVNEPAVEHYLLWLYIFWHTVPLEKETEFLPIKSHINAIPNTFLY